LTHPDASEGEAVRVTGLRLNQVRRTRAWKEHEEALVARYLKGNPTASASDVGRAFGFSQSKVVGMRAWREHQARRQATRPPRRAREQPLTAAVLACRSDPSSVDPADAAGDRDTLFRVLLEDADVDTRARLNRLSAARRKALLEHVVGVTHGEAGTRDADALRQLLVTVAQQWLEEHEQEGWRRGRGGPERRGP
jgi:hypothetical protein